ncbi:unnamed protein product [Brassicogethes aeneus]|uniref:Large ribosomal subunit protein bL34m n=1 Tax=Brassicogethes aeneus TaxID=1431903 RepID=A0A9P0AU79_BRAAE|nr:unnamed protein product [Brassicogethes aeneus]
MANLIKYIPGLFSNVHKFLPTTSKFHSLTQQATSAVNPGGLFSLATRNIIRIHFPRPSENKRVKRHGYKHRMSTKEGRRVIMNRILKGRYVITH